MSANGGNQPSKLEELYKWSKRPFLDKMIDDGVSANQCAKWCNDQGFEVSVPTMYKYVKRRKEAVELGVPLEDILDKREFPPSNATKGNREVKKKNTKKNYNSTKPKKKQEPKHKHLNKWAEDEERREQNLSQPKAKKVMTDLEMLDAIIQKGMNTLQYMEAVAPQVAIKAVELKNKITGGTHNGLTTYGLEEIRLREQARENAMLCVLLEYIPQHKHEEVIQRMEEATKRYYEDVGLGAYYAQLVDTEGEAMDEED